MDLKTQRAALLKEAQEIVNTAKAENRDLTEDEAKTVEAKTEEIKGLDVKIKRSEVVKGVLSLGGGTEPDPDGGPAKAPALTLGEHFAQHVRKEGLARLKGEGGVTLSTPEWAPPGGVPSKANTDIQVTTGAVWGDVLTTIDRTIVPANRPRPVVADLLASGQMASQSITYYVEGPLEGAFTTVAEAAQKPQLHFVDPTPVTDSAKKIAAWFDMSDEMVEDLPFYVSEINNRALYELSIFEEQQILNGDGIGTNLRGLLNRSGIQTETAADEGDEADALFRAITKVQTATGFTADGIVINPLDYQNLRLSRDGNEQYFGGGYFVGPYGNGGVPSQPPLWGLSTVVTSAVPVGTAVVGAFKVAATVYRKGGVRVESTNSDLGKFTLNVITTRIEERIALAVRVPAAIVEVTLAAPVVGP